MSPEGRLYLVKARRLLTEARRTFEADLFELAARTAYLAAFHSDQAFIFDRTGKVAKTHAGVRSEFSRLARLEQPAIDRALPLFLARGYELKSIADYGVDPEATVTAADADDATAMAARFVQSMADQLGSPED